MSTPLSDVPTTPYSLKCRLTRVLPHGHALSIGMRRDRLITAGTSFSNHQSLKARILALEGVSVTLAACADGTRVADWQSLA